VFLLCAMLELKRRERGKQCWGYRDGCRVKRQHINSRTYLLWVALQLAPMTVLQSAVGHCQLLLQQHRGSILLLMVLN